MLFVDLHGHSKKSNVFMYGVENPTDEGLYMKERVIPTLLDRASPLFSLKDCSFDVRVSYHDKISRRRVNAAQNIYGGLPFSLDDLGPVLRTFTLRASRIRIPPFLVARTPDAETRFRSYSGPF